MPESCWLEDASAAFRLTLATSWLAPDSWRERQEAAIRKAVSAGPDWKEYLRLVDRHRTPALSWAALKRAADLEIPEPVRRELQQRSDACRMQGVKHSIYLAAALKAFNQAGIPVMPLKGPILSFELYGDVGLRQSQDLDLAVIQEDIPTAQACLEKLGWVLDFTYSSLTPRQWEALLRHEYHLRFAHRRDGGTLELHWREVLDTPDQTAARWERSRASSWNGCRMQAMSSIDSMLFLCGHGSRHAWFRAKWLGDLARIHAEGRVDWGPIVEEAEGTGQQRDLALGLRLLDGVYGLAVPVPAESAGKRLPPRLIDWPIRALKGPEEPPSALTSWAGLLHAMGMFRYDLAVHPRKTWRDVLGEFVFRRVDFKVLPLPDRLFWAYTPLRPALWLWRMARRGRAGG